MSDPHGSTTNGKDWTSTRLISFSSMMTMPIPIGLVSLSFSLFARKSLASKEARSGQPLETFLPLQSGATAGTGAGVLATSGRNGVTGKSLALLLGKGF